MASSLDSKAVFAAKVKALGLGDFLDAMREQGYETFGEFAFAENFQGTADDTKWIKKVAEPILKENMRKLPALRRLFFESYTLMQAEMRKEIERTDDDKPRVLSLPERNVRRAALLPQLQGLDPDGVHNVSNALVNKCAHMKDTKVVMCIPWEECTTKAEENKGIKSMPEWKADSQGVVREVPGDSKAVTKTGTDYDLHNLLIRRGIGLAMGNVMKFKSHQKLTMRLMSDLATAPPPRIQQSDVHSGEAGGREVLGTHAAVDPGRNRGH